MAKSTQINQLFGFSVRNILKVPFKYQSVNFQFPTLLYTPSREIQSFYIPTA